MQSRWGPPDKLQSIHLSPVTVPEITAVSVHFPDQGREQTDVLLCAELAPNPRSLNWSPTPSVDIDLAPEGEGNAVYNTSHTFPNRISPSVVGEPLCQPPPKRTVTMQMTIGGGGGRWRGEGGAFHFPRVRLGRSGVKPRNPHFDPSDSA